MLAMLYATYIVKGLKSYSDVPDVLKSQVKQVLIDMDAEHLVEQVFLFCLKKEMENKLLDSVLGLKTLFTIKFGKGALSLGPLQIHAI